MSLNSDEILRYQRHLCLPNIGLSGQKKLKAAKVLCIGAGGLGSPALLYLCAAGVGTLGIIDSDIVDLSNLQRQVLFSHEDIHKEKVAAAKARLMQLNPHVNVVMHHEYLTPINALTLLTPYEIIIDCSDNFTTRYLINDACFHLGKPNVYASVSQFTGQCSVFTAQNGPCYRCLYDTPPTDHAMPNCTEGGVLGVLPGIMGTLQATEVIKLILGLGKPLIGCLLTVDALNLHFQKFTFERNPDCRLCQHQQSFISLSSHAGNCNMNLQNSNELESIAVQELNYLRQQDVEFTLLDVREPNEYALCNLGGTLIPLGELPQRLTELDKNKRLIIHCKSDGRSQHGARLLKQAGFTSVQYLAGGILAWAQEVDVNMIQY